MGAGPTKGGSWGKAGVSKQRLVYPDAAQQLASQEAGKQARPGRWQGRQRRSW